jgi:hypothetical protein
LTLGDQVPLLPGVGQENVGHGATSLPAGLANLLEDRKFKRHFSAGPAGSASMVSLSITLHTGAFTTVLSQSLIFGAKFKNRVSGIQ